MIMIKSAVSARLSAVIFFTVLCLLLFSAQYSYGDTSGTDGSVKWTYTEDTQLLVIDPADPERSVFMDYYDGEGSADTPWLNDNIKREDIKCIRVGEGITGLGRCTFYGYSDLEEVFLADTVKTLNKSSLGGDPKLKLVHLNKDAFLEYDNGYHTGEEPADVFEGCDPWLLEVDAPRDCEVADFCNRRGYRLLGQKISLRGAAVRYIDIDENYPFTKQHFRGVGSFIAVRKYTGRELKPVPVLYMHDRKLEEGKDFTVEYRRNIQSGTARCRIEGKGDYYHYMWVDFIIYPKGTSIKKVKSDSKGAAGISWLRQSRKMKTSRISGYEIQYWEKGKKNKQYKTVKGYKKVSATIKTMRSGKTYCFRVRTYMNQFGRRYYSSWSPGKNVKVK